MWEDPVVSRTEPVPSRRRRSLLLGGVIVGLAAAFAALWLAAAPGRRAASRVRAPAPPEVTESDPRLAAARAALAGKDYRAALRLCKTARAQGAPRAAVLELE